MFGCEDDEGCMLVIILLFIATVVFGAGFVSGLVKERYDMTERNSESIMLVLIDEQKKLEVKEIFDSGKNVFFNREESKFTPIGSMEKYKSELWKLKSKDLNFQITEENKEVQ